MAEIGVWAPAARQVRLRIGKRSVPMEPSPGGWWRARLDLGRQTDYAFEVDGSPPLPDPGSPWQPHGVHGPSRTLDHASFRWTDRRWQAPPLSSAVIYELHVGTFSPEGTFDGAVARLDRLADLGVTHLELMPVAEFPGTRGWGYDGVDIYAPHSAYGGPAGLKRFVDACHARGLAVLLDVVYNHLGPSGNYLGRFGPYYSADHRTPWGEALNFSGASSGEVRRFFLDNAVMWLRDYHLDGLRLDAVHTILDSSATHFLEELALRLERLERETSRRLVLTAESDLNDPRLVRRREEGGYGLDAQWSDDFHHALHALLTGERGGYYLGFGTLAHLAKAVERTFVYDGCWSPFRGRVHGRPTTGVPPYRFVVCMQNHDQVGNRAAGDRIGAAIPEGRLRIGSALTLLSPFVPLIFQGEEWNASTPFPYFTDHTEPELARAVSEGRRREFAHFGWPAEAVPDPQSRVTFESARLDWSEPRRAPHRDTLAWYRALIALRRAAPDFASGETRAEFDERAGRFVMHRGAQRVACNLGRDAAAFPLFPNDVVWLASSERVERRDEGLLVPPDAVAVVGPPMEGASPALTQVYLREVPFAQA